MKQQEISFFDSIAPEWDEHEVLSLPPRVNRILDLINIGKGMDVLDLGTGTGVLIPYLLERTGSEGKVLGVDISEGMLSIAHRKCDRLADYPLLLKRDFESEDIPGKYDVILLYSVYPHIDNPAKTLRRIIVNNLREGGSLFIAFPTNENFINNVHGKVKARSSCLPPADVLAERLCLQGFDSRLVEATDESYIVEIKG